MGPLIPACSHQSRGLAWGLQPLRVLEISTGLSEGFSVHKIRNHAGGVPGWLSQLSIRFQLRSWSHGSWVQAPHRALC